MIRIDEIYDNTFLPWFRKHLLRTRLFACAPFGRSDPDSIVNYGTNTTHELNYTLLFDQEPIDLARHRATFDQVKNTGAYDIHYSNNLAAEPRQIGSIITSEKDSDTVYQICREYGWTSYYYFFHGWAALDWYRGYNRTYLMTEPNQRKITRTFLAPNRIIAGERKHRLVMLYHIFKYGMTTNHISCPVVCPAENITVHDAIKDLFNTHPDIQEVFNNQTFPIEFEGESNAPMHSYCLSLFDQAAESLLYLVTETVATGRRLHLTEKTFKPICLRMPFMIVGTRGSLAYLRSYGFKTFGNLWDESYDDEIHDDQRIEKIAFTLKAMDILPPHEKQRLFDMAKETCEYNYRHFYGGGFEQILAAELDSMLDSMDRPPKFNFALDQSAPLAAADTTDYVGTYPYTTPASLLTHCRQHFVQNEVHTVESAPLGSYYLIGVGFFDFTIDYFGLLPADVFARVCNHTLAVLFYYHEGDNPKDIKLRLDLLCEQHRLPNTCYRFVSGNTAADTIPGFAYFPDHELLYWLQSARTAQALAHTRPRSRDFTLLSRTHKAWRASVVADLHRAGLLDNSYWSYNTGVELGDHIRRDNPIRMDPHIPGLSKYVPEFLAHGPYRCDDLTADEHNDHSIVNLEHYADSYCSIILETMYDADRSGGTFLTEKTFKAIRNGHPFVIVGPPGSLQLLRDLGYRTFDSQIDNSYDTVEHNTHRWTAARQAIQQIKNQDIHAWYQSCLPDIQHNQQLFARYKTHRLNNLIERLNND
jgi:hypothetical protein